MLTQPFTVGSDWPALARANQHNRVIPRDAARLATVVFTAAHKTSDFALKMIEKAHREAVTTEHMASIPDVSCMPTKSQPSMMPTIRQSLDRLLSNLQPTEVKP